MCRNMKIAIPDSDVDYLKRLVSLIYKCIMLHNFSLDSVFIFWSPCKICSIVGVGIWAKVAWSKAEQTWPVHNIPQQFPSIHISTDSLFVISIATEHG